MPATSTPLRYPGGKSQLRGFIRELIAHANTEIKSYAEPYCGGAGVAVDLLLKGDVQSILINDADPGIYSFWKAITDETERFIEQIEKTPVTLEKWLEIREKYRDAKRKIDLNSIYSFELGFFTFFLNRTNVSGIIEAGCIGGMSQMAKSKIDCRFNKDTLIKKIRAIGELRDGIFVSGLDGIDFLNQLNSSSLLGAMGNKEELLVYLDPPYVEQGKNLYLNSLEKAHHEELAQFLESLEFPFWMLTYDDSPLIRELYHDFDLRSFSIRYSANRRMSATELIVLSARFSEFKSRLKPMSAI